MNVLMKVLIKVLILSCKPALNDVGLNFSMHAQINERKKKQQEKALNNLRNRRTALTWLRAESHLLDVKRPMHNPRAERR
jgi:hypothetical protein